MSFYSIPSPPSPSQALNAILYTKVSLSKETPPGLPHPKKGMQSATPRRFQQTAKPFQLNLWCNAWNARSHYDASCLCLAESFLFSEKSRPWELGQMPATYSKLIRHFAIKTPQNSNTGMWPCSHPGTEYCITLFSYLWFVNMHPPPSMSTHFCLEGKINKCTLLAKYLQRFPSMFVVI